MAAIFDWQFYIDPGDITRISCRILRHESKQDLILVNNAMTKFYGKMFSDKLHCLRILIVPTSLRIMYILVQIHTKIPLCEA